MANVSAALVRAMSSKEAHCDGGPRKDLYRDATTGVVTKGFTGHYVAEKLVKHSIGELNYCGKCFNGLIHRDNNGTSLCGAPSKDERYTPFAQNVTCPVCIVAQS